MPLKKRPQTVPSKTIEAEMPCGDLYCTLGTKKGEKAEELFEVRMVLGKTGNCTNTLLSCLGILLSILLQTDLEREEILKYIKKHVAGSVCQNHSFFVEIDGGKKMYSSCIDFVASQVVGILAKEVEQLEKLKKEE